MESIETQFQELYGVNSEFVVRAPGRVNLIGEHTDYNDGFVFPAAIDKDVRIAGSARPDRQIRAYSIDFSESSTFSLDRIEPVEAESWSNYIRGVAKIQSADGYQLRGMNLIVTGTVPIGSGLSSSAAMELAACLAFEAAGRFEIDPVERALIGQRAEREFVGVNVGIMDQFISSLGRKDHALLIDTRSLEFEAVPLPSHGIDIVVADTNKRRGLVDSEYNARRRECEEAVEILKQWLPGIRALRDVTVEEFEQYADRLPETIRKRARHVVYENSRVLECTRALKAGDIALFGRLMNESHESLRDDYQVSCIELDVMVEQSRKVEGVYGSRMTGAGFGGCTVSLVDSGHVDELKRRVGPAYEAKTGLKATFHICRASGGAERIR